MVLYCWNVNGIRAAGRNGFAEWVKGTGADVICVQETKGRPDQVEPELRAPDGYNSVWHPAKRPGYSGVATFFRTEFPPSEVHDLGVAEFDDEGRVQVLSFDGFDLINAYFPNSQPERARLPYKLAFMEALGECCTRIIAEGRGVILCGDLNVAHKEIDLARPKENRDNPGFYPEECNAMDTLLERGLTDSFRHFHPGEPDHYTWWSYRTGARARNLGWRIDYHLVSNDLMGRVKHAGILCDVKGSDHCPVTLTLE